MFVYYLPFIVLIFASLLCVFKSDSLAAFISVLSSVVVSVLSIIILLKTTVSAGYLFIDGFSKIMVVLISFIYLTTVLFSLTYLKHVEKPLLKRNFYFLYLNLFVLSMLFSVVVKNLGLIWVGIEATTITSALLVAIDNDEPAIESAWRYIIIVSVGLVMSLVGVVFVYGACHTLDITKIALLKKANYKLLLLGSVFVVTGFATKAGIFPLHTWLPDVHGRAIAPISAIFSSILLPVALFGVYRVLFSVGINSLHLYAIVLGFLSVIFASIFLVNQKFYKRMFAYSSIENMGMILIGLAISDKYAFLGAVVLLVSHAFAKSSAFYSTGNVLNVYKTREVAKVKGMVERLPFTAYSLVFSGLAVTGAPPFGTFLGELLIAYGVYIKFGLFWVLVLATFLVIAFMSVNYKVARMAFSSSDFDRVEKVKMSAFVPLLNVTVSFVIIFLVGVIEKILMAGMIK